jgi:bifunctional non-homologous end joining protein LigD
LPVLRSSTFIPPCEPTLRTRLPKGVAWFYEVKFDGYRVQLHKSGPNITLYTRNGHDWTDRVPQLAASLRDLACESAIIDAELVHVDSFEALHPQVHHQLGNDLMLWGFDLMQLNGTDLRVVALEDRSRRLAHLLERSAISSILLSERFSNGEQLLAECGRRGLEGVVAKHNGSIYRSGRSTSWIMVKCPGWCEANKDRWRPFE